MPPTISTSRSGLLVATLCACALVLDSSGPVPTWQRVASFSHASKVSGRETGYAGASELMVLANEGQDGDGGRATHADSGAPMSAIARQAIAGVKAGESVESFASAGERGEHMNAVLPRHGGPASQGKRKPFAMSTQRKRAKIRYLLGAVLVSALAVAGIMGALTLRGKVSSQKVAADEEAMNLIEAEIARQKEREAKLRRRLAAVVASMLVAASLYGLNSFLHGSDKEISSMPSSIDKKPDSPFAAQLGTSLESEIGIPEEKAIPEAADISSFIENLSATVAGNSVQAQSIGFVLTVVVLGLVAFSLKAARRSSPREEQAFSLPAHPPREEKVKIPAEAAPAAQAQAAQKAAPQVPTKGADEAASGDEDMEPEAKPQAPVEDVDEAASGEEDLLEPGAEPQRLVAGAGEAASGGEDLLEPEAAPQGPVEDVVEPPSGVEDLPQPEAAPQVPTKGADEAASGDEDMEPEAKPQAPVEDVVEPPFGVEDLPQPEAEPQGLVAGAGEAAAGGEDLLEPEAEPQGLVAGAGEAAAGGEDLLEPEAEPQGPVEDVNEAASGEEDLPQPEAEAQVPTKGVDQAASGGEDIVEPEAEPQGLVAGAGEAASGGEDLLEPEAEPQGSVEGVDEAASVEGDLLEPEAEPQRPVQPVVSVGDVSPKETEALEVVWEDDEDDLSSSEKLQRIKATLWQSMSMCGTRVAALRARTHNLQLTMKAIADANLAVKETGQTMLQGNLEEEYELVSRALSLEYASLLSFSFVQRLSLTGFYLADVVTGSEKDGLTPEQRSEIQESLVNTDAGLQQARSEVLELEEAGGEQRPRGAPLGPRSALVRTVDIVKRELGTLSQLLPGIKEQETTSEQPTTQLNIGEQLKVKAVNLKNEITKTKEAAALMADETGMLESLEAGLLEAIAFFAKETKIAQLALLGFGTSGSGESGMLRDLQNEVKVQRDRLAAFESEREVLSNLLQTVREEKAMLDDKCNDLEKQLEEVELQIRGE